MLAGSISRGVLYSLLALCAFLTLVTTWAAAWLRGHRDSPFITLGQVIDHGFWTLLVFAFAVLGVRYAERLPVPNVGYVALGLLICGLSVSRGILYQRTREERDRKDVSVRDALRDLTYVLFGFSLYVGISLALHRPVWPALLVPLGIGSLLPDLDSRFSLAGRFLPALSRRLQERSGHGGPWHSLAAAALVALVAAPLLRFISTEAWVLIPTGFLSHLLLDTLRPRGTMLLWPASRKRYFVLGSLGPRGGSAERRLLALLVPAVAAALLAADLGPPQTRSVVVAVSYEESLARFDSLRGRYLVVADVDGTWQATNRRVTARYEVLSAMGESLVMLDRYTGRVFRAGRQPEDHLYLDRLSIAAGSPVRVKPVEIHLQDELVADALPVVYQMQAEPGLQHIFVSGTIVVPTHGIGDAPELTADQSQTQLRRIVKGEAGEYDLQYLTARELIDLANIRALRGELLIVATYISPGSGPTVTPLPSPAVTAEAGQAATEVP